MPRTWLKMLLRVELVHHTLPHSSAHATSLRLEDLAQDSIKDMNKKQRQHKSKDYHQSQTPNTTKFARATAVNVLNKELLDQPTNIRTEPSPFQDQSV